MKMLSLGMVQISTEPIVLPAGIPERPKVWFVAASDAASGATVTASRRHERYTLNPLASVLLPLLHGHIVISGADGEPLLDDGHLREAAAKLVDRCLQSLSHAGMLVE
jgi:hypothetical protein